MQFVAVQEPSILSRWTSRLAVFALVLIVAALFLHRLFGMPTPVAFNVFLVAYACAGFSVLTAIAAAVGIWRNGGAGTARVVLGLVLSFCLFSIAAALVWLAREYPSVNDVTTDVKSPPLFVTLAKERWPGANPVDYPGERFAAIQQAAYPDLKPMLLDRPRDEAFELVGEAVRKMRMEIVREEEPSETNGGVGSIEAIDRTIALGFYDDVSIRVEGDEERARVDLRSASRFGISDFGHNADRMRLLMKEIVARLEATVPVAGEKGASAKKGERDGLKKGKDGDPKSAAPRKQQDRERSDSQRAPKPRTKPPE